MQKLYRKSEIWFAVVWIVVYVLGTSAANAVSKAAAPALHILLSAVLLIWIRRNGLCREFGLCRPAVKAAGMLYYLPLIIIVSCNFWFGTAVNMPAGETALYIISMLCVGFLEEIIFRGLLFRAMSRDNVKAAVIVSSLTFGIGHIVNLVNGSGADTVANICQICYAVACGFLFVIIFIRSGSLLPCIAAHSVMNALSAFAREPGIGGRMITAAALTLIALAYAVVLIRTIPAKKE